MSEDSLYCFIDTNTLLHYQLFTEINWIEILSCNKVIIIICYPVIKELDKEKYKTEDIKIKKRSTKVISKISKLIQKGDNIEISKNIFLKILTESGKIDWDINNLDKNDKDDQILGFFIYFDKENKIIVSSDLGLQLKARAKGITCISLPNKYLIAESKTNTEKEIIKLKDKIVSLESHLPNLKLDIDCEKTEKNINIFSIKRINNLSDSENLSNIDKLRIDLEYKKTPSNSSPLEMLAGINLLNKPPESEFERYEKEVKEYLEQMMIYFRKLREYEIEISKTIKLDFICVNDGSWPAEDISIFINFPDGFDILKGFSVIEKPEKPHEPLPPRTAMGIMSAVANVKLPSSYNFNKPIIPTNFGPSSYNGPIIKKTNSYEVTYHIDKIKHKMLTKLNIIYLHYNSYDNIKSFQVNYTIIAGNSPEPFSGVIPIIFII